MNDTAQAEAVRRSLRIVQRRRKMAIRLILPPAAALLVFFQSAWPLEGWAHESIETAGIVLLTICILGRAWCTLYIGGKKAHELIDMGPYSLSRNPLYMFSFIGALGVGLQSGSLVVGLIFLGASVAVFVPVVMGEEKALSDLFGPAFEAYKARAPRFWPRLAAWREAESLSISTRLLYITIRDGLAFAMVIPLFEAIDWLQDAQWVPVLASLP